MNMLRALMGEVDFKKEQIGNVSKEMEILRTKKKNARDQKH